MVAGDPCKARVRQLNVLEVGIGSGAFRNFVVGGFVVRDFVVGWGQKACWLGRYCMDSGCSIGSWYHVGSRHRAYGRYYVDGRDPMRSRSRFRDIGWRGRRNSPNKTP